MAKSLHWPADFLTTEWWPKGSGNSDGDGDGDV